MGYVTADGEHTVQVISIRPDLKEQIDRAVLEAKTKLRTELAAMINQKVVLLEMRMEAKINEVRQGTTSLLEELKTTVAAGRESQEKMGQTFERMSNKVQELVQKDAGIEDEEETDPWPARTNWDENLPAPSATSSWDQPLPSTPSPWLAGIPEEEEKASVKDSVTSGLPARERGVGVEASGSTGQLVVPEFKFGGSFVASHGSTEDIGKWHSCHQKKKKGSCHWV